MKPDPLAFLYWPDILLNITSYLIANWTMKMIVRSFLSAKFSFTYYKSLTGHIYYHWWLKKYFARTKYIWYATFIWSIAIIKDNSDYSCTILVKHCLIYNISLNEFVLKYTHWVEITISCHSHIILFSHKFGWETLTG